METLLEFAFKFSISLSSQYLLYVFLLRRLTFYRTIRFFFITVLAFSFILPFVNLDIFFPGNSENPGKLFAVVPTVSNMSLFQPTAHRSFNLPTLAGIVILTGTSLLICRLLIQLVSLAKIRRGSTFVARRQGVSLYELTGGSSSFSFGRMIFINRQQDTAALPQHVIAHETIHAKQMHTVDVLLMELACILNWYNPFAWLMRRAMRQNLEFIADHEALRTGFDVREYQYSILRSANGNSLPLTNSFSMPTIKKRIAMINVNKSSDFQLLKFCALLPLVFFLSMLFRQGAILAQEKDSSISVSSESGVFLKGAFKDGKPLVIVDGLVQPASYDMNLLKPTDIKAIDVWKGKQALEKFGKNATEGALAIRTSLPLYVLNGKVQIKTSYLDRLVNTSDIEELNVLKGKRAIAKYGDAGKNSAIEITTKNR